LAIGYINQVLRGVRTVSPTEKLILVIISDYARSPGGTSWPSVDTIAWEACIERRQAIALLARLRAEGWIEALGSGRGGRGKSTHYRLNLKRIVNCADVAKRLRAEKKDARERTVTAQINSADGRTVSASETVQPPTTKGAVQSTKGAVGGTETVQPAAPEPLNLAVISTGFSRTSNPLEKVLDPKGENPNATPLQKLGTMVLTETEAERAARIEAERDRQLKAIGRR
jgi:nucleotidyltransferase/DNA polymerase involved in DNA repair